MGHLLPGQGVPDAIRRVGRLDEDENVRRVAVLGCVQGRRAAAGAADRWRDRIRPWAARVMGVLLSRRLEQPGYWQAWRP